MNKIVLFTGMLVYLLYMTSCGGRHDHSTDVHDDHAGEATIEGGTHTHANGDTHSHDAPTEKITTPDAHEEDDHESAEGSVPEHTVITTSKQEFNYIIRAGGTILPDSKDIINVTAKASGIVRLNDHFLFPGVKVIKGTPLFTISGDELTSDNTEIEMRNAKSDFEMSKEAFQRAERLIVNQLITMDKYLEAKNNYEKAEVRYNNLRSGFGASGNVVVAPDNGYINEVFITEGTKVSSGEKMISVIIEHNLVLQADVSPEHIGRLGEVKQANFRLTYGDKIFDTREMNGKLISYARNTGSNSYYIPVYFSINFLPEIIPGTYAEVFLKGSPKEGCIVIPNTSILEEYGKYFVFVEEEEHHFVKRYITRGMTDGASTEILNGLAENEIVVATGAYAIKMSQMSTTAPDTHKH